MLYRYSALQTSTKRLEIQVFYRVETGSRPSLNLLKILLIVDRRCFSL